MVKAAEFFELFSFDKLTGSNVYYGDANLHSCDTSHIHPCRPVTVCLREQEPALRSITIAAMHFDRIINGPRLHLSQRRGP